MRKTTSASRKGVFSAGSWIIDQVKLIDVFPQPERLANIRSEHKGTGGAPYNVLLNLAKLGVKFPLIGAGLVGRDALGQDILNDCKKLKIDARLVGTTDQAPTSYTDVVTEPSGRRTFFHNRGANALWTGADIDFSKNPCRIFHLGYLLLLDAVDAVDPAYGTKGARLLAKAQEAGLKTSIDVVSEDSDRFAKIIRPALKHVDYCILNEIESGKTAGFKIRRDDGRLDTVALRHAAGALLQCGVREMVVIHYPEGAFLRTRKGEDFWQSSLNLPPKYIAGAAGAGDAFCTGMLLGLHEEWELQRCLETAVLVAAASLSDPTCTGGVGPLASALALAKKFKFRPSLENAD